MSFIATIPVGKITETISIHAEGCKHLNLKHEQVGWSGAGADPDEFGAETRDVMSGLRDDGVVNYPWKYKKAPCVKKESAA